MIAAEERAVVGGRALEINRLSIPHHGSLVRSLQKLLHSSYRVPLSYKLVLGDLLLVGEAL